jgi:LytR cell envelope-related transcriptional attenuator
MDSWVDILLPGAAVLALFGVVGLVIQVIRLGRALRRFEERSALGGGSATDVSLRRLQELQARMSGHSLPPEASGSGGGEGSGRRRLGAVVAAIAVLAVAGGGGWYFFIRDDGGTSGAAESPPPAGTTTTTTAASPAAPNAVATGKVPANPKPLENKASYTVAVLNASGVAGAAGRLVGPKVTLAGYILGRVANAQLQDPSQSVVMWPKGKRNVAWNVAKDLKIKRATPLDGISSVGLEEVDAIVVVGLDLAQG